MKGVEQGEGIGNEKSIACQVFYSAAKEPGQEKAMVRENDSKQIAWLPSYAEGTLDKLTELFYACKIDNGIPFTISTIAGMVMLKGQATKLVRWAAS